MTKKFAGAFGCGVRRDGLTDWIFLAEGNLGVYSINRRRRSEDELFDAVVPRKFEQMQGAADVGFTVQKWLCEGWSHAGASGEVNNCIEVRVSEDWFERFQISNINFGEGITWIRQVTLNVVALDPGFVEVVKVVDYRDVFGACGK